MTDVFLSYSRRDSSVMALVRDALRSSNLLVWTDENLVPGTPQWQAEIERTIETSSAMVVLLSPDAKQSDWVNREILYAQQQGKRIFPVLIRETEMKSVPLSLANVQFVNARIDFESALQNLVIAIKAHVGLRERTQRFLADLHDINRGRGWEQKPFGQTIRFHDNKRTQITERDRRPGNYPYYGAAGIIDYIDTYNYDGEYLLVTAVSSNLHARRHPIAFKAKGQFSVNTGAHVMQPVEGFYLDYLMYFLWVTDFKNFAWGTVFPHINQTALQAIPVAFPPYPEQVRLATYISDQLNALERTRISLEQQLQVVSDRPYDILQRAFTEPII